MPSRPIADRFELVSIAGEGGMGRVFRARDLRDGATVALKVLRDEVRSDDTVARFRREVDALAQLDHPAIVRYVAHGSTHDGGSYLAMEWIDGGELRMRLKRGTLEVAETLTVGARVAAALAHAHARSLMHRDVKPANIVLRDDLLENAMLIDFGLARTDDDELTRAGVLLGTPTYMAPEQARGEVTTPSADAFALGCVLFHCLAGRSPFHARGATAVIARVLFEDPPPLSSVVANIPAALSDLVASMLRKLASERPSMQSVLEELTAIAAMSSDAETSAPEAIGVREQRVVSVVVTGEPATNDEDDTLRWVPGRSNVEGARLLAIAARFGAQSTLLPNGSLVAVLSSVSSPSESATDLAMRAAELALALKRLVAAPIGLATGRAEVSTTVPVGEAIDRAIALAPFHGDGVRVDEVTASLLDDRFVAETTPEGIVVRKRRELGPVRTLLGKPTPCVGRDAELAMLEGILAHCVNESVARVVLVTSPAGFGKSRLRHEYLRRLRARPDDLAIWSARGDSVGGAPLGMIAHLIRETAGIVEGEPAATSWAKLRTRVRAKDRDRVATFLAEILGLAREEAGGIQLEAARRDPMLMSEQTRRAFTDFVDAETASGPLVIVLEDLHWGDLPTVQVVDHVLRLLSERPLLVIAFARPDIGEKFPTLFQGRDVQPIPLAPLPRKAAERLVAAALENQAKDVTERLVEQAAGNVFYLEELIRAIAEKREAPPTVVAMVQSRLTSLEPRARRVLRAASIFGETFWSGGVRALLGGPSESDTRVWLDGLVQSELCTRRPQSRLANENEYVFRHALVREGAYAMLTAEDAALGHRLAAEWLEQAGENAAAVIAEHFYRAGETIRATARFLRAAEDSLASNDLAGAIERAERGVSCGATGPMLGALRNVQAQAHSWRGETVPMERAAAEAVSLLTGISASWADALAMLAISKQRLGHAHELPELARRWMESVDRCDRGALARAGARLSSLLTFSGQPAIATEVLVAAQRVAPPGDRAAQARIHHAHAPRARQEGHPAEALSHLGSAEAAFRDVGDERSTCLMLANRGFSLSELGAYREALPLLEQALAIAERLGLALVAAGAMSNLGMVRLRLGDLSEAERLERAAVAAFAGRDRRQEGIARAYLALTLHEAGRSLASAGSREGALAEARTALGLLESAPPLRPYAAAVLAMALLAMERPGDALEATREAVVFRDAGGQVEEGDAMLSLAHARALHATGDLASARAQIVNARDRLLERAAAITSTSWKRTFLENVPEHVTTFELAEAWR